MTGWLASLRAGRARRQAASWVARLNGPGGERDRARFEHWYRSHPEHTAAYDRMAALFEVAGQVPARPASALPMPRGRPARTPIRYAFAAATAACMVVAGALLIRDREAGPSASTAGGVALLTAGDGSAKTFVLADGSRVTLLAGSRLETAYSPGARRLRLLAGEGRFDVAAEGRPFIVVARETEVVARGTRFVVRLGELETFVSLIEGRIDVSRPGGPAGPRARVVTSLGAGGSIVVPALQTAADTGPAGSSPARLPAMIEFDDVTLAEALAQARRQAGHDIRLDSPGLARLRVSGAYKVSSAETLAAGLAATFGLEVERAADGRLTLVDTGRPGGPR
jgi:transmembrane sensor